MRTMLPRQVRPRGNINIRLRRTCGCTEARRLATRTRLSETVQRSHTLSRGAQACRPSPGSPQAKGRTPYTATAKTGGRVAAAGKMTSPGTFIKGARSLRRPNAGRPCSVAGAGIFSPGPARRGPAAAVATRRRPLQAAFTAVVLTPRLTRTRCALLALRSVPHRPRLAVPQARGRPRCVLPTITLYAHAAHAEPAGRRAVTACWHARGPYTLRGCLCSARKAGTHACPLSCVMPRLVAHCRRTCCFANSSPSTGHVTGL